MNRPSSILTSAIVLVSLSTLGNSCHVVTPALAFTDPSGLGPRRDLLRQPRPRTACSLDQDDFNDKGDYDYDELFNSPEEKSRIRRRTVFDHERWLKHRSTDRFFRNLSTIPRSYVLSGLLDEVAVIAGFALFILVWNEVLFDGWTDLSGFRHEPIQAAEGVAGILPRLVLPTFPFSISSSPLGLLLVFRTNSSYTRWMNGGKSWGTIMSRSRSLLLTAGTWLGGASSADTDETRADKHEALKRLGRAAWALPRTLRKSVSGGWDPTNEYESDMRSRLDARSAERILCARNPVLRAQSDLMGAVEALPGLGFKEKLSLSNTANMMVDLCGECEGLYTSPVPLSYTRHTARFLTIWMLLLPAALYEPFSVSWNHMAMVPAIAVLSVLFFGVEEIAVSLEEPFSILPLEQATDDLWLVAEDTSEWFGDDDGSQ